jgi:hypothetical protein
VTIYVLLFINVLFISPLVINVMRMRYYAYRFDRSKFQASMLGYLISINGPIRIGKTSFQSGLKHLFELEIEYKLQKMIMDIHRTYPSIDFNRIDDFLHHMMTESIPTDQIYQVLKDYLIEEHVNNDTLVFNFIGHNTTSKNLYDYMYAFWVLNYRRNYVHSKTKFYSHITNSMSMDYDVGQQKINKAYENRNYSIYDYAVELIDEASDDVGANKRYEDVKEEDGDKDYRRKYGQIHQEYNRLITTKQEVKDEIKRFRQLTQSNLWMPVPLKVVNSRRTILRAITHVFNAFYFIYDVIVLRTSFYYLKIRKMFPYPFDDYKQYRYQKVNLKRRMDNYLMHVDWLLKSFSYNRYVLLNYADEEDVKKKNPDFYDQQVYYIPTIFCWGTYDTHYWRIIQEELMNRSKRSSKEDNVFDIKPYFQKEKESGDDKDDLVF